MLSSVFFKVSKNGLSHVEDHYMKSKISVFNRIAFFMFLVDVVVSLVRYFSGTVWIAGLVMFQGFSIALGLLAVRFGKHLLGRNLTMYGSFVAITMISAISGRETMTHILLIFSMVCLFLVYDYHLEKKHLYLALFSIYLCFVFLEYFAFDHFSVDPAISKHTRFLYYLHLGLSITVFGAMLFFVQDNYRFRSEILSKNEELERNKINLKKAKERAEKALKVKAQFLSNMSHEMRTPLNSMLGFTEILMDSDDPNDYSRYLKNVHGSAENMARLVNDVLDYSKFESENFTIRNGIFSLRDILDEIGNLFRLSAKDKGVKFFCHIHPSIAQWYLGDGLRIEQIVTNLLSNAVKFTASGELRMTVSLVKEVSNTHELKFEFLDTGVGIRKEHQSLIFDGFSQVETEDNRNFEGSGLGLSIVKKLTDRMGGRIEVESEIGVGSNFSVWLPLVVSEKGLEVKTKNVVLQSELEGLKILVVDDNDLNLMFFNKLLSDLKLRVTTCSSGKQGLLLLSKEKFDFVMLDFQMPEMTGIEVFRELKSDKVLYELNQEINAMMVTADVLSETNVEIESVGISHVLYKPVRKHELIAGLNKLFNLENV